jgi:serine/threonine-protein kinase TNNI3K
MLTYISRDPEFARSAHINIHRLLVKICQKCRRLPSFIFVKGVKCYGANPVSGGAFADIYRGRYNGKFVALKRMRVFQANQSDNRFFNVSSFRLLNLTTSNSTHVKLLEMFCREALVWKQLRHPHILPFHGVDCEAFSNLLCMVSPWLAQGTIIEHLKVLERNYLGMFRMN